MLKILLTRTVAAAYLKIILYGKSMYITKVGGYDGGKAHVQLSEQASIFPAVKSTTATQHQGLRNIAGKFRKFCAKLFPILRTTFVNSAHRFRS